MPELHKYPTLAQVLVRGNDAGSVEITNVDDPTSAQSVATKHYVDGAIPSVPSTTDGLAEGTTNLYYTNTRADARITAQKGVANGIAPLDASSKIASSYLPAIAIVNTFVVASQAAMLALTVETGDVAVRTDINKSFILAGTDPTILGDWQELLTPTDAVSSVNGQTGAVSLTTTNISEGTNLYYTSARFDTAFGTKTTTDLTEGTNLYYTIARFNSAFSTKTTTDLSEGTNLYYTNARGVGSTLTGYTSGAGTVSATDTILQAIQKLNGNDGLLAPLSSPSFTGTVTLGTIQSTGSGGITIKSNAGTNIVLLGAGGGATGTFYGGINFNTQITIGTATGTTGSVLFNGTTSGTVTLSVADAAGTWTMKLPTGAGTTGQVLTTDGAGNTSWTTVSGGGSFSWGATASGTSGTGVALAVGASASASTIGQSIIVDNTQINVVTGLKIDNGTSAIGNVGLLINAKGNSSSQRGITIDLGSTGTGYAIEVANTSGTMAGALFISTVNNTSATGYGIKINTIQAASSGTSYGLYIGIVSNVAAINNAYGIYIGTVTNQVNQTAYGMYVGSVATASSDTAYGIYQNVIASGGTGYGMYLNTISSGGTGTGIYFNTITTGSATGYGLRIFAVQATANTNAGYGIYFSQLSSVTSSTNAYGIYFNTITSAGSQTQYGMYFNVVNGQNTSVGYGTYIVTVNSSTNAGGISVGHYIANVNTSTGTAYGFWVQTVATAAGISTGFGIDTVAGGGFGNGYYINKVTTGSAIGYGFRISNVQVTSASNQGIGFLIDSISSVANSTNAYGIYFTKANGSTGQTSYLIYTADINNQTNGTGYGEYVNNVVSNTGDATFLHVANLATAGYAKGKFFSFNNAQSASLTGRTTDASEILHSRTNTATAGTITDNFNLSYWKRTNVQNGVGGTLAAQGSVLKLENAYTQTAGTLTDTVTVLSLVQGSGSTGAPLSVTQNNITSTNFRKVSTETNTGKSIWVSNGTTPNGNLTGTAGDICYGADNGNIYYCTGTTNWSSYASTSSVPRSDIVANSSATRMFYSDHSSFIIADVSGSNALQLFNNDGDWVYNGGVAQQVAYTTIWASATSCLGVLIQNGYVYAALRSGTPAVQVYRCAITSDIATGGNWTLLTISGTAIDTGVNAGFIGYGNSNFWFLDYTNSQLVPYSLSGTTLTSSTAVTVTGSLYDKTYYRVSGTGIYANFAAAPIMRYASFAGTLDTTKQRYASSPSKVYATNLGFYTSNASVSANLLLYDNL